MTLPDQSTKRASLTRLMDPERVVLIGAKEADGNRGAQAASLLRKFGYKGTVTPVHPSGGSVAGYAGARSLDEVEETPDVALVAVGARNVARVITEVGAAGIPTAIVWAGGFAEGGDEGARLQADLAVAAREAGVRVLGPNCLGLVNTSSAFCGTFALWLRQSSELIPGHISMVTQSGGLGAFAQAAAQAAGIGFRYMASTGNEMDLKAVDLLEVYADDPETHVICCYLEGLSEGRRMIAAFERARERGKDVVVLKAGRSEASALAAAAHTGAIAGEARVWDAILAGAGAIQVYSVEELVDVAASLAASHGAPPLRGRRTVIMSYGGGSGVLAADQAVAAGLEVPTFSEETQTALRPLVPEIASIRNPIDLTPEAFNRPEYRAKFGDVLDVLARTDEVDAVVMQTGSIQFELGAAAASIVDFQRTSGKLLAIYWPTIPEEPKAVFRDEGVLVFQHQHQAVRTLARCVEARSARTVTGSGDRPAPLVPTLPEITAEQVLGEDAVHAILRDAGIATLQGRLARDAGEAARIAAEIGLPVAMKLVSEAITHRAAAGLVRLNVGTADDVRATYGELRDAALQQGADVQGVYVQRMAPSGTEFLVSMFRDPTFGPVISCGAGGVYTEALDDVVFAPAPLSPPEAHALVGRLRLAAYLRKSGREAGLDRLASFLVDVARLGAGLPWQGYVLEINPVVANANEAIALDGLLIVQDATPIGSGGT